MVRRPRKFPSEPRTRMRKICHLCFFGTASYLGHRSPHLSIFPPLASVKTVAPFLEVFSPIRVDTCTFFTFISVNNKFAAEQRYQNLSPYEKEEKRRQRSHFRSSLRPAPLHNGRENDASLFRDPKQKRAT